MKTVIKLAASLFALSISGAWAETVAIITPYLAQPEHRWQLKALKHPPLKKDGK